MITQLHPFHPLHPPAPPALSVRSVQKDHAVSREAHGLPPVGEMTSEHVESVRGISAAILVELFGHPGGHTGGDTGGEGAAEGRAGLFQEALKLSVGRLLRDIVRGIALSPYLLALPLNQPPPTDV